MSFDDHVTLGRAYSSVRVIVGFDILDDDPDSWGRRVAKEASLCSEAHVKSGIPDMGLLACLEVHDELPGDARTWGAGLWASKTDLPGRYLGRTGFCCIDLDNCQCAWCLNCHL